MPHSPLKYILRMKKVISFLLFSALLFACSKPDFSQTECEETKTITLTFAGDIMAHNLNFNMRDYSKIYEGLSDILLADDLSFANLETPVCDSLPLSTYPRFNVHFSYLRAAKEGGFDVFSLANNHTNDQGITGIEGTFFAAEKMKKLFTGKNGVYFSGLKKKESDNFECTVIHKNGFTVSFLSVTEILNSPDESNRFYYSKPTKSGRENLLKSIKEMRNKHKCDLFVLALHLAESEYKREVSEEKRLYFHSLAEDGVDIIYGCHPHVMQTWEKVPLKTKRSEDHTKEANAKCTKLKSGTPLQSAFFMYSMGNFISAQRFALNYENPGDYMEYTGDAVLLSLTYTKKNGVVQDDFDLKAIPITVQKTADGLVLRRLDDSFIFSLSDRRDKKYYSSRLSLLKAYLPLE